MRSSASIGVNLRVTGHCRQGGRKYMEDFFSVAYQQTEDEKDLEYAFFGIYDGHGGAEAAAFAKEHLMETIIKHKNFWSDYDEDVLRAIKDGYIATHYAMWKEQEKWPRTASGLPSTAGTTASIAFIRRGKIFIGHVGDSGIILGYQEPGSNEWKAKPLTRDHKPENADEMQRIKRCGGKVVSKSGVPRVVWNRPRIGHQGPVRRSTPIDEIPFLAVARSLGDLWSYNSQINQFIVSPDPDCSVMKIDTNVHRCLIFGTDGLYNMLSPGMAVQIVQQAERHNEYAALSDSSYKTWLNPSKLLVEKALERWHATKMRADNTSVVTLMLDPPGPPKAQVLKDRKKNLPERGLRIMTRFDDNNQQTQENNNCNTCDNVPNTAEFQENPQQSKLDSENVATPSGITSIPPLIRSPHIRQEESGKNPEKPSTKTVENDDDSDPAAPVTANTPVTSSDLNVSNFPLKERNFMPKLRESTSFDPREPRNLVIGDNNNGKENKNSQTDVTEDNTIQCNEVSSSNLDIDNLCTENEEVESSGGVKQERHNLRSTKKVKSGDLKDGDEEENVKTSNKRKFKSEMSPIPRKSMRIDKINSSQKKSQETPTPPRRAFEAEEKLKKLAQQADLAKKLVSASPKESSNSKSEETKKQSSTDSSVAKKKIQLVLQKVKKVQKKGLLNPQKRKLLIVGKKQTNSTKTVNTVVATKVGFQRHLKKNHSQRVQPSTSKSVDGPTRSLKSGRIVSGNQNISKSEVAKIKTAKKLPEVEVGTSRSRSASATPRNSVPLIGQPEKIQIQLTHVKQKYNWDCGVSCVLMVLPKNSRHDFLKNFTKICKNEGFDKSTWTIDLCYLLRKFDIRHSFFTTTLGVHEGYRENNFYHHVLTKDESRVNARFQNAANIGIVIKKSSLSLRKILSHLVNGPIIALTNSKLLSCDICKLNKISAELRKCIPWPVPYQGHYIVICGYDINLRKVFYRNPSFRDHVCAMPFEILEAARKSFGTDEDLIFIFN